ncbi:hypothetical protein [Methylopila turkensis]|uniref:Uncharacterized protein n=1 Tax=Methylopila turkensis TaxID=1437816 RepID=A0A9W6JMR5_9HYPH|nr:hypothetical protein [Methylopila turkensis]GLK79251.1 hypothetical protein GCM10008174_09920 [Methylopila turkensis]
MAYEVGPIPRFRPAPFGLARGRKRVVTVPEPAADETVASAGAEADAIGPEPAAAPAAEPPPAPAPQVAVEPPPRRRLPGGSEARRLRQTLSDALGLWRGCGLKPCRRARTCVGVRGGACLADRPPELEERLAAFRRALADAPRSDDDDS